MTARDLRSAISGQPPRSIETQRRPRNCLPVTTSNPIVHRVRPEFNRFGFLPR